MKIETKHPWLGPQEWTVSEYVSRHLDDDSYDSGALENVERACRRNREAIAQLVALLASKGLLTAPEVTLVAKGYEEADARFTD